MEEFSHDLVHLVLKKGQIVAHALLLLAFLLQLAVHARLLVENGIVGVDLPDDQLPLAESIQARAEKLDQANQKDRPKRKDEKGLLPSAQLEEYG